MLTRGPQGHNCAPEYLFLKWNTCWQWSAPIRQTWWRMLSTCLLPSFVEFHSAVAEKSWKCLGQQKAGAATSLFCLARKTQIGRWRWGLASFSRSREEDRQGTMTIAHTSLQLSWAKNNNSVTNTALSSAPEKWNFTKTMECKHTWKFWSLGNFCALCIDNSISPSWNIPLGRIT